MKYKIIGLTRKSGEYDGNSYDNTYLHCTYKSDDKDAVGLCATSVKVKTDRLPEVHVGDEVSFLYDQWRNVELVQVYK